MAIGRDLAEDEIDFESGFLMMPDAIPAAHETPVEDGTTDDGGGDGTDKSTTPPPPGTGGGGETTGGTVGSEVQRSVQLTFRATRDQVYKAFNAIANLADKSDGGVITIRIEGTATEGYDGSWLRNAVLEPLDEADIDRSNDA